MGVVTHIVIHHTAGNPTDTVEEIRAYHTGSRGWRDIGYHWLIREEERRGRIYQGRPHDFNDEWDPYEHGAHTRGANDHSVGVALIGRFDGDRPEPSPGMTGALISLLAVLCSRFGLDPREAIQGHRDMPGASTVCPGVPDSYLDSVRAAVAFLLDGYPLN